MSEGLKPCPFCGTNVKMVMFDTDYGVRFEHPDNGCIIGEKLCGILFHDPAHSIEFERRWNTRSLKVCLGDKMAGNFKIYKDALDYCKKYGLILSLKYTNGFEVAEALLRAYKDGMGDKCSCDSIEIIRTHEGHVCAGCGKLK